MADRSSGEEQTPEHQSGGTDTRSAAESRRASYQERRQSLAKVTQVIWLVTSILEVLIGVRVLLKLLGANPQAPFAQFIYSITAVFLAPFNALFTSPAAGASVLEISSLVAMLVYALIAWGVVRVMWVTLESPPREGGGPGAPA